MSCPQLALTSRIGREFLDGPHAIWLYASGN